VIALPPSTEFKIERAKRSAQEQITNYFRGEIYNGNLKPGVKLSSNLELATRWTTHQNTVQRAMVPLVKEGLLLRIPYVGTFVRQREEKLTCVGVYGDCGAMNSGNSPFAHAMRQALKEELRNAGIEMDLWMDPRPLEQQLHEPWKPLFKAAEQRRFQAFIGAETNTSLVQWQNKLPVPVAFLGAPTSVPNNVDMDLRQFVEGSLGELARQGCRSVGLIAPILAAPNPGHPVGGDVRSFGMLEHFTDVADDLGLTVKNDWMRVIKDQPAGVQGDEHFGYEQFLKLWNQPEKPEGLLIFYDTTVRGSLMAIREKQVRVPDELKLVLHKNETIELLCPMPATFVVASERGMARALIEQVQKQFRGESCERISLPLKLAAHNNP